MTTKVKIAIGTVLAVAVIGYFTKDKWMPLFKKEVAPAEGEEEAHEFAGSKTRPTQNKSRVVGVTKIGDSCLCASGAYAPNCCKGK